MRLSIVVSNFWSVFRFPWEASQSARILVFPDWKEGEEERVSIPQSVPQEHWIWGSVSSTVDHSLWVEDPVQGDIEFSEILSLDYIIPGNCCPKERDAHIRNHLTLTSAICRRGRAPFMASSVESIESCDRQWRHSWNYSKMSQNDPIIPWLFLWESVSFFGRIWEFWNLRDSLRSSKIFLLARKSNRKHSIKVGNSSSRKKSVYKRSV